MTATTTSQLDRVRSLTGELLERERWSRDRLLTNQQERLRELLAHAVSTSPYYREALGDDPANAPFDQLPTLPKSQLVEQWDRIVCDPRLRRAEVEAHAAGPCAAEPYLGEFEVFSTSGSSGLRGLFVYDARDWAASLAQTMRALARTGARPGERTLGIGAPPGVHMSQRVYVRMQSGDAVPQLSALTPLDEMVEALNAFQPEILLGYPTVGAVLAAEQLAGRLRIAPRMMAFGSEPFTAEMRDRIEEAWGIDACEYYPSTEAATIASSTAEHPRTLEIFEDQYVVEIVDEDNRPVPPGTPGAKVLITNLESRTLPLIRYELSDRVTESPDPNPAGRPFRHLAGIDGRTADTLTFAARAGGTVAVLPLRMGAPFARLPEVRQFQIVHDRGGLEVRLVLDPGAGDDTPARVRVMVTSALEEAGAVPPPIAVTPVAELEREPGPAAKLKLIVSRTEPE